MKSQFKILILLILLIFILVGCSYPDDMINVISREDGSGTRDAFSSLFDLTQENEAGLKKDLTLKTSEITNSTAVVLQTVSEDTNAIGYISMGSLNDQVKAISIDQISPTLNNIKNQSYPIYRPFILIKGPASGELEEDFINFVKSSDGASIIQKEGYLPESNSIKKYIKTNLLGKITINGSSSVTPVIEALSEKYEELNPQIDIEVQQTDSTTGVSTTIEGISTIGMSSRELKKEEIDQGLTPVIIAYDGLAVIVNKANPINNLSLEDVHDIYTGKIRLWTETD